MTLLDRTFWFAEVHLSPEKSKVNKTAAFHLPPDVPLEKPESVGKAIGAFLHKQGFRSSQVVVGLPAKQLIAVERETPPSGVEEVKGVLRMAAERLAVSENQETVFDYVGNIQSGKAGRVLMVGALGQNIDRIQKYCDAAELEVQDITSSSLSLLVGSGDAPGILILNRQGAEFVWRRQDLPRMLKHLNVPMQGDSLNIALFASDLRRAVSLAPSEGIARKSILLWDGIGLSNEQIRELSDKVGVPIQVAESFTPLGLSGFNDAPGLFAQAAAVAMASGSVEGMPVNFLDTKLAPPKESRINQPLLLCGSAVALIILGMVFMFGFNKYKTSQLDQLTKKINGDKKSVDEAKKNFADYSYVKGYFLEGRPQIIKCLYAITEILATNGPDGKPDPNIWLTKFTIKEDNKGEFDITISGKASSTQRPLVDSFVNSMQSKVWDSKSKTPKHVFSNVKPERTTLVNTNYEFSVSCNFNEAAVSDPVPPKAANTPEK
jgi:hypothetical protein